MKPGVNLVAAIMWAGIGVLMWILAWQLFDLALVHLGRIADT
jgi:hypothetical protein